ncbi:MAG TPA: methyltransferase domain-containing protein [Propionibacteriaceae bacterium]|jgi:ubiquinone/menaquinone biosynthesis C-methylase UbiE
MLAQVSRRLPTFAKQVGRGEATGLPESTADLVTFAQSWHWVEPNAGSAETARILKPGGAAGWLCNFVDGQQQQVKAAVDAFVSRQFPDVGAVDLPYRTHCFRADVRK